MNFKKGRLKRTSTETKTKHVLFENKKSRKGLTWPKEHHPFVYNLLGRLMKKQTGENMILDNNKKAQCPDT